MTGRHDTLRESIAQVFAGTQEKSCVFRETRRTPCGHDPLNPRHAERPKQHKRRSYMLENAISTVKNFVYTNYQLLLPGLKNKSGKKKRTDRLEAICAILTICLHYTCLATLRISKGRDSGCFIPPSLKELAAWAKLPFWRASRALADLEKAGYMRQERRIEERERGGYFSLNALRQFTKGFFYSLGIRPVTVEKGAHWKQKTEWLGKPRRNIKLAHLLSYVSGQRHSATIKKPSGYENDISLKVEMEQAEIKKLRQEKYPDISLRELLKIAKANDMTLLQFLWLPRPEPPS
jgi:hypothetical protein